MNEILAYIQSNRKRVTVGYELPDGKIQREFRKIIGTDTEAITQAIDQVKAMGVKEVILEVFRPNGTAEVLCKTFRVPNDGKINPAPIKPIGNLPLFADEPQKNQASPRVSKPIQSNQSTNRSSSSMDWRDYALKTEQEKVSKLEAELRRVSVQKETLDKQVRDFEKEMIKKDHEIEKLSGQVENKSGLAGFAETVSKSPEAMNVLSTMAARLLGVEQPQQQLPAASLQGTGNPTTDQYLANIAGWLVKQPEALQEQFYAMIVELTKASPEDQAIVSKRIITILNFLTNGTTLKRSA